MPRLWKRNGFRRIGVCNSRQSGNRTRNVGLSSVQQTLEYSRLGDKMKLLTIRLAFGNRVSLGISGILSLLNDVLNERIMIPYLRKQETLLIKRIADDIHKRIKKSHPKETP